MRAAHSCGVMLRVDSPIQNSILSKLKNAKMLPYARLHQKTVANDLFNYHLQSLVKKGYVMRSDDGYRLAEKGLQYIADPVTDAGALGTSLFKINVITIVSRAVDSEIEILNQFRRSNPSFGKVGVMGGTVQKGETVENAAARKLLEETGLIGCFRVVGMNRRHLYKDGELFSDVLFPIAYCGSVKGQLLTETEFGENFWVGINQAIRNDSADYDSIESIPMVLKAIKQKKISTLPFFYTETEQRN